MNGLEDRQALARDIYAASARLQSACKIAGFDEAPCSVGRPGKAPSDCRQAMGGRRRCSPRQPRCEPAGASGAAVRDQRAALRGRAVGAYRAHAGQRGLLSRQRIQHGARSRP